MFTTTNNTVENSVVDTLEQLLQRSVIDLEFRSELFNNPEAFGILVDTENLVLPKPVAPQDMLFMVVVAPPDDDFSDSPSEPPPNRCISTCISGYTMRCDGTTY
jgi:hypothetical protein